MFKKDYGNGKIFQLIKSSNNYYKEIKILEYIQYLIKV